MKKQWAIGWVVLATVGLMMAFQNCAPQILEQERLPSTASKQRLQSPIASADQVVLTGTSFVSETTTYPESQGTPELTLKAMYTYPCSSTGSCAIASYLTAGQKWALNASLAKISEFTIQLIKKADTYGAIVPVETDPVYGSLASCRLFSLTTKAAFRDELTEVPCAIDQIKGGMKLNVSFASDDLSLERLFVLQVTYSGGKTFEFAMNASRQPLFGAPDFKSSCELTIPIDGKISMGKVVNLGETLTYQITVRAGLSADLSQYKAYWVGTSQNGQTGGRIYQSRELAFDLMTSAHFTSSFTVIDSQLKGSYNRAMEIYDQAGNLACKTNCVSVAIQ